MSQTTVPTKNEKLLAWVEQVAELTRPDAIHWCDGSAAEYDALAQQLVDAGTFERLSEAKRPNSYLALSDPGDVARVEDRTFICAEREDDAGPTNNWREPTEMRELLGDLFAGCMEAAPMYVVRPSMHPAKEVPEQLAHLGRLAPVAGRAGVVLALGADEGTVLDAATSPGPTGPGWEFWGASPPNVPASTSCCAESYSAAEPSPRGSRPGASAPRPVQPGQQLLVLRAELVWLTWSGQLLGGCRENGCVQTERRGLCRNQRIAVAPLSRAVRVGYSTLPSAELDAPGCLRGTRSEALELSNEGPRPGCVPACGPSRSPGRAWTATRASRAPRTPRSRVSPWKTGAGCLSSSVARLAMAETSETIPSASE